MSDKQTFLISVASFEEDLKATPGHITLKDGSRIVIPYGIMKEVSKDEAMQQISNILDAFYSNKIDYTDITSNHALRLSE